MSKKILVVLAHPNYKDSIMNKEIFNELKTNLLPNAEYRNLIELYPNGIFDVKKEQESILKADIILCQFPFWWYNAPWLFRKWYEDVFIHNFAYGSSGSKVAGKTLVISLTGNEKDNLETEKGRVVFPIKDYLHCFMTSADLCQLKWGGYVYTGGVPELANKPEIIKSMKEKCKIHAKKLVDLIKSL